MKVIDAIIKISQLLAGTRSRRELVLTDFETFFRSEVPGVRTKYLKSLEEDEGVKGQEQGAPAKVGRKKTSRAAASEDVSEAAPQAAEKKERRTKKKFDHPSVNQVKVVQNFAATTVKEVVPEEVIAEVVKAVLVEFEKNKKEVEKKKKKKSNKNAENVIVVEKKKIRKR